MREAARDVLNELKGNARTSIPLLLDNDTLAEAVKNHHFVGGAGFWRTTRTLFGLDHEGKIKDAPFKYADFRQELLDTVDLTWDTLVGQRMIDKGHDKKYLERAWFSAQWIDCVLIDGFGLPLKGTRTVEEEKAAAVAAAKVNKAIEKKVAKRMLAFKMKLVEKRDNKSAMWNGGEVVGDGVVVEDEGVVGDGDVDLDDEDFDSNGSASEDEEPSPLHEEVELSFQPYNGPKGAELSWTLGRVVLLATGDDAPETMTGDAAIDTMSARTTSLRRDALATDLRGKSKDLGYRRDSYLKRAAEVKRDFDKFKFKLLAQICDAQSAHYEGEADRVLGGSKCVPPRKVPGDALLL
jgi:hypothetical protein